MSCLNCTIIAKFSSEDIYAVRSYAHRIEKACLILSDFCPKFIDEILLCQKLSLEDCLLLTKIKSRAA